MEINGFLKKSHQYTEKASDIARNLSLAGIGIIWIVIDNNEHIGLRTPSVLTPLILISFALLLDFIQYVFGGIIWKHFNNKKLKENDNNGEVDIETSKWRNKKVHQNQTIILYRGGCYEGYLLSSKRSYQKVENAY